MIAVTILFIISILFSRVMVNVLVFVLRVVFFHLCIFATRYMYDAVRRDFALSASSVLECSDGSEVTTREGKGKLNGDLVVGNLFITELTIPLV